MWSIFPLSMCSRVLLLTVSLVTFWIGDIKYISTHKISTRYEYMVFRKDFTKRALEQRSFILVCLFDARSSREFGVPYDLFRSWVGALDSLSSRICLLTCVGYRRTAFSRGIQCAFEFSTLITLDGVEKVI